MGIFLTGADFGISDDGESFHADGAYDHSLSDMAAAPARTNSHAEAAVAVSAEVARLASFDEACRTETIGRHQTKGDGHVKAAAALTKKLAVSKKTGGPVSEGREIKALIDAHLSEAARHRGIMARCIGGDLSGIFKKKKRRHRGAPPEAAPPAQEAQAFAQSKSAPVPQAAPQALIDQQAVDQQAAQYAQAQAAQGQYGPPQVSEPQYAPAPVYMQSQVQREFGGNPMWGGHFSNQATPWSGQAVPWGSPPPQVYGPQWAIMSDVQPNGPNDEGDDDDDEGLGNGTDGSVVFSSVDEAGEPVTGDSVVSPLERLILLRDVLRTRCKRQDELRRNYLASGRRCCGARVRVRTPRGVSEALLEDAHLGGDNVLYGFSRGRLYGCDQDGMFNVDERDTLATRGPASATPWPVQISVERATRAYPVRLPVEPTMAQGTLGEGEDFMPAEPEYVTTHMNLSEAAFNGNAAFDEFGDMAGVDANVMHDMTIEQSPGGMGDDCSEGEDVEDSGSEYDGQGSFGYENLQNVGPAPRLTGVVVNDFDNQPPLARRSRHSARRESRERETSKCARPGPRSRFGEFGKSDRATDLGQFDAAAAKAAAAGIVVGQSAPAATKAPTTSSTAAQQYALETRRLELEAEQRSADRNASLFSNIFGGISTAASQITPALLAQRQAEKDARAARQAAGLPPLPVLQVAPVAATASPLPWIIGGGIVVLGLGAMFAFGGRGESRRRK